MEPTFARRRDDALRTMCEAPREQAKAHLSNGEMPCWQSVIGRAIDRARLACGWNMSEFAALVGRDRAQISRWIAGTERPQFDALFAVEALRGPLVVQLAALSRDIEVQTVITLRRTA